MSNETAHTESGAGHLNESERRAAFSAGPPKMSRRVIAVMVAVLFVLGFGGIVVDHFFPGTGSPTTTTTTTSILPAFLRQRASGPKTADTGSTPVRPTVAKSNSTALSSSLDAMMDLTRRTPRPAAGFSLDTSNGKVVSLASLRGKVVVISFFNASCNDICHVLAAEIQRSDDLLGSKAAQVEYLTINTDPTHLSLSPVPAAVTNSGLASLPNWDFLSGPERTLNAVWTSYGLAISVVTATKVVSHNDVLDFIDTKGRLRFVATPFANESRNGKYSLDDTTIERWGMGIAEVISTLLNATT